MLKDFVHCDSLCLFFWTNLFSSLICVVKPVMQFPQSASSSSEPVHVLHVAFRLSSSSSSNASDEEWSVRFRTLVATLEPTLRQVCCCIVMLV